MNAAVENLRVKQCGMLLAYSSTRHPAVTPGQTRQALLQASAPTLPACLPAVLSMYLGLQRRSAVYTLADAHAERLLRLGFISLSKCRSLVSMAGCTCMIHFKSFSGCMTDNHTTNHVCGRGSWP